MRIVQEASESMTRGPRNRLQIFTMVETEVTAIGRVENFSDSYKSTKSFFSKYIICKIEPNINFVYSFKNTT